MPGGKNVVLVGTADPGTGEPRSMFFTNDELRALVARGEMRALPVWLEHGDASKEQVGQVEYAWVAPDGMHVMTWPGPSLRSGSSRGVCRSGASRGEVRTLVAAWPPAAAAAARSVTSPEKRR